MPKVTVYTKSSCPYCVRAKRLLDRKGVVYEEVSVEGRDDLRLWLAETTGQKTVPQVFVGDRALGGFTDVEAFADVLSIADSILERDAPFHIHFSDIQFANRNETKHLPYGEGTLRAEPLRDALARFKRPATVISESPDEASSQAIRSILEEKAAARPSTGASSARRVP